MSKPTNKALEIEIAARMPWLHAKAESWWEVNGSDEQGTFTGCLARVLPQFVTGSTEPLFEILIYGGRRYCPPSSITAATELMLVLANQPRCAFYEDDQDSLDHALEASDV